MPPTKPPKQLQGDLPFNVTTEFLEVFPTGRTIVVGTTKIPEHSETYPPAARPPAPARTPLVWVSSHRSPPPPCLKDPGLLAVARGCPKLEKLMLTGCGAITGKSVRALARGCVKLKDLSLSGCGGVGNGDLKALAKGCTALRHLNIAECAQVGV